MNAASSPNLLLIFGYKSIPSYHIVGISNRKPGDRCTMDTPNKQMATYFPGLKQAFQKHKNKVEMVSHFCGSKPPLPVYKFKPNFI